MIVTNGKKVGIDGYQLYKSGKMRRKYSHEPVYTISTAARLLNISVHTIRMYEKEGLIIPYKTEGNQRRYSQLDLERLKCIRRAINEDKMGIKGIKSVLALIPCWAIVNCTEKDRKNCNAFSSHDLPCWTLNHKNNVCATRDCYTCEVYNSFGDCGSIKELLKDLIKPKQ